jgi:hypothetical protein
MLGKHILRCETIEEKRHEGFGFAVLGRVFETCKLRTCTSTVGHRVQPSQTDMYVRNLASRSFGTCSISFWVVSKENAHVEVASAGL